MPMTRDEAIAALTAPGEPYELEWVVENGRRVRMFRNGPRTLRDLYEQTASDAPFLVWNDETLTFAQAWDAAARIAQRLVDDCGVRAGDRVAISMRNYPEWVLAFCATTSIGAIAVAMNAFWQPEEMAYGLADCGAKVLFADDERLARLARAGVPAELHVVGVRIGESHPGSAHAFRAEPANAHPVAALPGVIDLATWLARPARAGMPAASIGPCDPATIFYTSGSTGHPKGVLCSHRNVLAALGSWELDARAAALATGVEPPVPPGQPATLLAVPLFHATGSHAVYLMSYRLQRRLVCMYKWDPALAAEIIERERITSFVAPAAMTGDLVRVAASTRHDLSSLMSVGGGGAPRAPEQVRQIDASFARAQPGTGWGMTETNAIGTGIGGPDYLRRPASSGRCSAVLELKVVDERGAALPAGARGELLVRGTAVFRGYWGRPDVDAQVFDADGWFRTGDVAYLDDEGYLFIVDRIKDLIIRGGENVGCGHVEAALLAHPDVHEAAVYAVPDERLGEEVGATVHGAPGLDPAALREYLAHHLAHFEVPRYLRLSDGPLPRTPSGKVLKRQLRDEAVAALAAGGAPPAG